MFVQASFVEVELMLETFETRQIADETRDMRHIGWRRSAHADHTNGLATSRQARIHARYVMRPRVRS